MKAQNTTLVHQQKGANMLLATRPSIDNFSDMNTIMRPYPTSVASTVTHHQRWTQNATMKGNTVTSPPDSPALGSNNNNTAAFELISSLDLGELESLLQYPVSNTSLTNTHSMQSQHHHYHQEQQQQLSSPSFASPNLQSSRSLPVEPLLLSQEALLLSHYNNIQSVSSYGLPNAAGLFSGSNHHIASPCSTTSPPPTGWMASTSPVLDMTETTNMKSNNTTASSTPVPGIYLVVFFSVCFFIVLHCIVLLFIINT